MPYNKEKTTVYLDHNDHRRLKALAAADNRPTAELIRAAVAEYVRRHDAGVSVMSIGAARSGRTDLSERAEELLEGFGV
ncbi:MAG: ribbon-helix-helix domain-containing protein [Longimicrobiales bacterium]